jgi:hypothetical protein
MAGLLRLRLTCCFSPRALHSHSLLFSSLVIAALRPPSFFHASAPVHILPCPSHPTTNASEARSTTIYQMTHQSPNLTRASVLWPSSHPLTTTSPLTTHLLSLMQQFRNTNFKRKQTSGLEYSLMKHKYP